MQVIEISFHDVPRDAAVEKLIREKARKLERIYFHRNSVLEGDFDRLEVGTGVNFFEHDDEGEHGPQASTVRIVDKPGVRAPRVDEPAAGPPLGWS
jgi:hypothetical protein